MNRDQALTLLVSGPREIQPHGVYETEVLAWIIVVIVLLMMAYGTLNGRKQR
jgi:hypothetical protein